MGELAHLCYTLGHESQVTKQANMLEFEKLAPEIEQMAQGAYQRAQQHDALLEAALARLHAHATDWGGLAQSLQIALGQVDGKLFRSARPVDDNEPLDVVVDAPPPPPQATLMASDGSQILPDRHAAYLYSLINIGVITYYHGQGRSPAGLTYPTLDYPDGGGPAGEAPLEPFVDNGAIVYLRRDLAEIETLANTAWDNRRETAPRLAVLDQRLLYWPTGGTSNPEGQRVLDGWQRAMVKARDSGALLAGYIVKPGKRSVLTMLETLRVLAEPDYDAKKLELFSSRPGPTDAHLFQRLLRQPGQRSKVFVDVSQQNNNFRDRDAGNEVCFFYFNPGRGSSQLARVDIPLSVAQDPAAVAAVHALLFDQCQIMGGYPYILTRADELAVVSYQDQEGLNLMIDTAMQRYDLRGDITAKQSGKNDARAGQTKHGL